MTNCQRLKLYKWRVQFDSQYETKPHYPGLRWELVHLPSSGCTDCLTASERQEIDPIKGHNYRRMGSSQRTLLLKKVSSYSLLQTVEGPIRKFTLFHFINYKMPANEMLHLFLQFRETMQIGVRFKQLTNFQHHQWVDLGHLESSLQTSQHFKSAN